MEAIEPVKYELVRKAAVLRMRCHRLAMLELIKGYSDAKICQVLHMSEGQLALFRNRNALILEQCHEKLAKAVVERTTSGKGILRIGAAKLMGKTVERYAKALDSENEVVALRAADSLANRVDPIKQRTEVSVVELSQKTVHILSRGNETMGELIADAEVIGEDDA